MNRKKRKRRKRAKQFKNRTDRHHIHPQSRGKGDYNNIVVLDMMFHRRWHDLFQNLTLDEVYEFISIIMQPNQKWTAHDISKLRNKVKGIKDVDYKVQEDRNILSRNDTD